MAHRRWTKKKQVVQAVVFGRSCLDGLRCRSSSMAAPRSRTELEEVRDGDERARTAAKMRSYRMTPRVVGTILAPFYAVFELGWRGRQLNFAVALSSSEGVAGMAKIGVAPKRNEGLTRKKERENHRMRERYRKKMFCSLFSSLDFSNKYL